MAASAETARAKRLKERSEIKRAGFANRIRAIHHVAVRSNDDPSVVPQLMVMVEKLDDLWVSFSIEDEALLDQLLELDLVTEYSDTLGAEMFELISVTKAIAHRCIEYGREPAIGSEQGGSRGSLSNAVDVEPQPEVCNTGGPPVSPVDVHSHATGSLQSNSVQVIKPTRLPEIPLPTYHGDIFKWISFRDRFSAMVDRRANISDIEKFYYLVGCCKGDALDAIRGIPVSDNNYKLAWSTLKERFDKPRLVAFSLVDQLLNAPKASTESLAELNKFLVIFDEGVSVLESMNIPDLGDFMLFSLASRCLPTYSIKLFEAQLENGFPTVKELLSFVKSRVAVLECVPRDLSSKSVNNHKLEKGSAYGSKGLAKSKSPHHTSMLTNNTSSTAQSACKCCNGAHTLLSCAKFKGLPQDARNKWAREQRICFRCLHSGHWVSNCKSSIVCSQCSRKHHSLLHPTVSDGRTPVDHAAGGGSSENHVASSLVGQFKSPSVLLGTALVHIHDNAGVLHVVRALIDSASQISAITSECSSRLGLQVSKWTAPVSGIAGAVVNNVLGRVKCQVQPRFAVEPLFKFNAWVFPSITADMPRHALSRTLAEKYKHLALADPSFTVPGTIDVLLGADLFAQILNGKRVSVGDAYPVAFGTVFGWTVVGSVPHTKQNSNVSCPTSLTVSVEALLERFWEIEEPEAAPERFTDEGQCASLFREGCMREITGRFCVPLLFRRDITDKDFRGSHAVAKKRFEQLERKLMSDVGLRKLYCDFMREYLELGHMSPATADGAYFIPHHAIYRSSDICPKLRVVFDASASSFSGTSLNDCLFPGPKLQRDIVDVLLLYRVHRHAFATDISKMYRQISISSCHRRYQHIVWRASPDEALQTYELNTVTYGVNCAPYLALRILQCIADEDCFEYPLVREALLYCTYVDDICVGGDSVEEVVALQKDLIQVLRRSQMQLKKWASNTFEILEAVPPEDRACELLSFDESSPSETKVLGLQWLPREDNFTYTFHSPPIVNTKRGMLSCIARMFDPLGLLSPVVFLAKQLLQRVWRAGLSWDEPLPPEIADSWNIFINDLPKLQHVNIPRYIGTRRDLPCVLCGFCDASSAGYAAVVYLRVLDSSGRPFVSLLGAKTKMAPLKPSTIPRLELCAALLLARWMARIRDTLSTKLDIVGVFAWSDSVTVLNWLQCSHESFKVFVSNRVFKIQSVLPQCQWNYIASSNNPADCSSRGLLPSELIQHELYLHGPEVLYLSKDDWDTELPAIPINQLPEARVDRPVVVTARIEESEWYARFSSYVQLIRVTARARRFIARCRREPTPVGYISRDELDQAAIVVARSSQVYYFRTIRQELSHERPVSTRPIARLRPFIDEQNLIRVGGRLSRSGLPENQKHPILLNKSSYLSLLLIRHWHDVTGHSGPRIISSLVSRTYWILSLRTLIRSVVSRCTICVRLAAANPQPVMADLPASRVTESSPFSRVGIDYAGPLLVKENRLRKARQTKIYVAVFVCFAVRAVHLELVSDLSTEAFIAALNRFVARRGLPTDIFSDCGTNFIGADNHLRAMINDPVCRDQLTSTVHCVWHFNPPGAPHFGGLWEAAVRSTKSLLVRIMGEHVFTLEEFNTVLCRVEAILNSRPLTPLSSDPADLECLTPGHFLVGRPLLAIPEVPVPPTIRTLVNRWKLINQCVQSFWRRWRNEYLQTLQTRSRWTTDAPNITVDDLVIIKDPQTPPLKWRMGRVTEVIPGADKVVRVVRLRTATGTLTRPVVKIVKLPTNE